MEITLIARLIKFSFLVISDKACKVLLWPSLHHWIQTQFSSTIASKSFFNELQNQFCCFNLPPYFCAGEMAERSNAAVLKTVDCNRSGGSNPSLSALLITHCLSTNYDDFLERSNLLEPADPNAFNFRKKLNQQ